MRHGFSLDKPMDHGFESLLRPSQTIYFLLQTQAHGRHDDLPSFVSWLAGKRGAAAPNMTLITETTDWSPNTVLIYAKSY